MKIWCGFGSEHSANLVMIGHFKDAGEATKSKAVIDAIASQVSEEVRKGEIVPGEPSGRYGEKISNTLKQVKIWSLAPHELEQFEYEVSVKVDGSDVVLTTDEMDVSAFLKVLIDRGARVEVYSAHEHTDTKYGRGK